MNKCPICEIGHLKEIRYEEQFVLDRITHPYETITVDNLDGCLCDFCGSTVILSPQVKSNHIKIAQARHYYFENTPEKVA